MRSFAFYLGLGFLFTHEMDAMTHHEWRVLPLTSWLPDATGELVFLIAHVPLFAVTIAFVASLNAKVRALTQNIASGFLIVHAGLHAAFSGHEAYEFSSLVSSSLIYGAALCGVAFFGLGAIERGRKPV